MDSFKVYPDNREKLEVAHFITPFISVMIIGDANDSKAALCIWRAASATCLSVMSREIPKSASWSSQYPLITRVSTGIRVPSFVCNGTGQKEVDPASISPTILPASSRRSGGWTCSTCIPKSSSILYPSRFSTTWFTILIFPFPSRINKKSSIVSNSFLKFC